MDKHDGDVPADLLRKSLLQNKELLTTFNRAWPLLEAADLVGDLWSVPAYLRMCAPWLSPDEVRTLQREDAQAWTVSDLPLLDAARQRLGDPEASRRKRRHDAAVAAEREQMAEVVDDLIAADDSEMLVMSMLRGEDLQDALVDEAALPSTDPDLLAGPFAHIVVDEAQELTDAEWQMLLLRCPSRSFTIVGDRAQARHGFTESWQERLERIGLDRINLASLSINYRTPEEVMAEAEPVIRAVLPDANVPTSIRSSGVPVVHGSASDLGSILDTWLAAHADGIACVIGDPTFRATSRVRSLTPELSKGLEFDLVVLVDPEAFGDGHRRSGRPLRRDDPSDPATRHPHELLTSAVGLVADPVTLGCEPHRLVGDERRQHHGEQGQRDEGGDEHRHRQQDQQRRAREQTLPVPAADVAAAQSGQRGQVEHGAAVEGDDGHPGQRVAEVVLVDVRDVLQDLLHSQGEVDDAGHHREVQVGVGVARQPAARLALELGEHTLGDQRDDVEVHPPQGERHPEREQRGEHDRPGDGLVGDPRADCDDRLADRDDDDQPVALGEVRRAVDAPALGAAGEDARVVDHQREHPEQRLPGRADGTAGDEQQAGDRGGDGGDEEMPSQDAVLPRRDEVDRRCAIRTVA